MSNWRIIHGQWLAILSVGILILIVLGTFLFREYKAGKRVHTDLYKMVHRLEGLHEK